MSAPLPPCPHFSGRWKRSYRSRAKAERARVKLPGNPRIKGGQLRAYHCNLCGAWHLTSRPDRKEAA